MTSVPESQDKPAIEGDVDKNSEYYKKNLLPVDRGYAWAICLGGFICFFIVGASTQAMVILFVEIIDKYDTTITTASLIFMFSILSLSLMSLISTNLITPRFGERKVVFFSGFLVTASSLGYSLSPSIEVFIVFAVVKGLGIGLMLIPGISLIRHYFHKRRSIAQILGNSGQSVAAICIPPIVRAVRKEYGISGTFMIFAAVELHLLFAGLLLRPVEAYKFRPELQLLVRRGKSKKNRSRDSKSSQGEVDKPLKESLANSSSKNMVDRIEEQSEDPEIGSTDTPNGQRQNGLVNSDRHTLVTKRLLSEDGNKESSTDDAIDQGNSGSMYTPAAHYTSAFSITSQTNAETEMVGVIPEDTSESDSNEDGTKRKCKDRCYKFFSLWTFWLILISSVFGAVNLYMKNYIAAMTKSQGATLDESAVLLTIVGCVDLVSRLCLGLFTDTHILEPSQTLAISQISLGILCQFIRLFTNFETLIIMAIILGLFTGSRIALAPLLAVEVVGVEKMPQAFSIMATMATLVASALNPIFGAVAEEKGNFIDVMHIVGVMLFMSSGMLLLKPLVLKMDKKRGKV